MDELLVIWSNAGSATSAASSRQSFQFLPTCAALFSRRPLAVGILRRFNAAAIA
jgi:hypothetical protein